MKYTIKELLLSNEKASKRDQITGIVQEITKEIKLYGDDEDLKLLERLLKLCIQEKLDREISKMYRNIGRYYYGRNMPAKTFQFMDKAVGISGRNKHIDLEVMYLSEQGLLYFYELRYEVAKKLYDKAQRLLKSVDSLDPEVLFSLYYRSGILHNYMGKYDKAFRLFKKAWEYAEEQVDKGRILMNIGVNRKRRGQFKAALGYYTEAMKLFEAEGAVQECDIYNNLAELYKVTGDYDKALEYIQKAFICLNFRDVQRYFVYFQTYIEIKTLKGEVSQYLEMLIAMLSGAEEYITPKCFIVDGFNAACSRIPEEKNVLRHLREEIAYTMETAACYNEDYKNELAKCLADVCISLKLLNSY